MNELLYSGLITAAFTLAVLLVFVFVYWAFRGFLPGSRLVEMPLVAPNDLNTSTTTFKLFHTKWCPYSREAVDTLKQFEGYNYTYGGKKVNIEYIDCEVKKSECALYKVDAYPTYKLETSTKMYEYVGPADLSTYRTFFRSALGQEEQA